MTQQLHVPQHQATLPPQPTTHMPPQMPPAYQPLPPRRSINPAAIAKGVFYVATFCIAVAALIVALNRPSTPTSAEPAAASFSVAQTAAAKDKACVAGQRVSAGIDASSARPAPGSPEDALGWANTANSRAVLLTAAVYLPTQVDPAVPQDIKDAAASLSTAAGEILTVNITESTANRDAYSKAMLTLTVASKELGRLCSE